MEAYQDNTKKIDEALAASGQPTLELLQQAAAEGFKSVVNLRLDQPHLQQFLENEQSG